MPESRLRCFGVWARAFSILVMAAGCYESGHEEPDGRDALDAPVEVTDPYSDGAFFDCPAPEDVGISISMRPGIEQGSFASTGEVMLVAKEADGMLVLTIDFTASGQEPNEIVFHMPIPEGVDVDLHPGDGVDVEYTSSMTFWWPLTNLRIWKNEEIIVQARLCTQNCIQDSLVVFPLTFSLLSGRCEPEPDNFGCVLYERLGYTISCESGAEEVDVFDHGYVHVPCGPGYHVVLGDFDRLVERLEDCMDIPGSHMQILVLKHGDGLGSTGP